MIEAAIGEVPVTESQERSDLAGLCLGGTGKGPARIGTVQGSQMRELLRCVANGVKSDEPDAQARPRGGIEMRFIDLHAGDEHRASCGAAPIKHADESRMSTMQVEADLFVCLTDELGSQLIERIGRQVGVGTHSQRATACKHGH